MAYFDGFVLPVALEAKDRYIAHARAFWPLFQKYGARRMVECWGEDVPDGTLTSFPMAVKLAPGETVVFSWIEWPDRATRDACHAAMESEPLFAEMGDMPFDGKRMIFGGFVPVVDTAE